MGGCATKPKADAAEPPPELLKEVEADAAGEAMKEVAIVEREKEVAVDIDNKRQSLSHLFMENEGKEPTVVVETPAETKVIEQIKETEKPIGISEHEKIKTTAEMDVVEVPVEGKTEKAETVEEITETLKSEESKTEAPEEEKVVDEVPVPVETEIEKGETIDANTETPNSDNSKTDALDEEKVIEETPVAEPEKSVTMITVVSETSEDKQEVEEETPKEKKVEENKLATEIQVPEASEEKKVVEEVPVGATKSTEIADEKVKEEK